MSEHVEIRVNGHPLLVPPGISLAAALLGGGIQAFRRSVQGSPRGPVCGMGVCYECRVTVDGVPHVRACLEPVRPGMEVLTDA